MINQWKSSSASTKKELVNATLNLNASLKSKLTKKADKVHNKVFQKIDCLDCANCCSSIPPIVTRIDAKRISAHLNLSIQKFSEKYLRVDEDGDTVFISSPCVFLEEDNRCQIYEVRPKACRAYPHTGDSEFTQNIRLHSININYCPAVFHILERLSHIE